MGTLGTFAVDPFPNPRKAFTANSPDQVRGELNQLAKAITGHDADATIHVTDALQTTIDDLVTDVATNTSDIATNTSDIADLAADVAALSGLGGLGGIPFTMNPNATVGASTTTYGGPAANGFSNPESTRQVKIQFACTVSQLRVLLSTNMAGGSPADLVVTLRKNGSSTALALTILSTDVAGMYQTTAGSPISFSSGDTISVQFAQQSAGASGNIFTWSVG